MQPVTKPRYISNEPPGKDLYEGQPQEKVAGIIAKLLQDKTEDSFKLIGLDGSWGAGKSNLIRILESNLKKHNYHFFVFDAWSHQEDTPRRAFLEEFTADMIEHNVVNSQEWEEQLPDGSVEKTTWKKKLQHLLAKNKVTETKTIPHVGPAYYLVLLALALIPFAKSYADFKSVPEVWKPWITVLPLFFLGLVWGIAALASKRYRSLPAMFALYKGTELEKTVSETISETEPTVRQFRDWLTDLSNDLVRPVVVVFDNMDRMPKEKVKALWSAIQTFFSEAKQSYPKIRFIVPFDRGHISKVFDEQENEVSTHFINKTFPVVLRVAPPPLTGWKGFFSLKFNEAFEPIKNEEFQVVEGIYDLYHDDITPRSIIHFINEMVTLKLLWEDQIAMRYLALFVASQKELLASPLSQLIERTFAAKADVYFRGDDELPKNMAALVYNVPLEKASQVALYREIQVAFRNKDYDKIKLMAKLPDFFIVLKKVMTGSAVSIGDYVLGLHTLDKDSEEKDTVVRELEPLWRILAGKQTSNQISILEFDPYYPVLIEKVLDTDKLRPLIRHMIEQFHSINTTDGATYYKIFHQLENLVTEKNTMPDFLQQVPVKSNAQDEFFLSYAGAAKEDILRYKVSINPVSLDWGLARNLPSNLKMADAIAVKYFAPYYKLPQFEQELAKQIVGEEMRMENTLAVIIAYNGLALPMPRTVRLTDVKVSDFLEAMSSDTALFYEAAAIRVAIGRGFTVTGSKGNTILDESGDTLVREISSRVEIYSRLDDFIIEAISWNKQLPSLVAKLLVQEPRKTSTVSVQKILPYFDQIVTQLNITETELFYALDVWTKEPGGNLGVTGFEQSIPDPKLLAIATSQTDNNFSRFMLDTAKQYAQQIEKVQWVEAFSGGKPYLLSLLLTLLTKKIIEQLPDNAVSAFIESIKAVSEDSFGISQPDWSTLYEHTKKELLEATLMNITDDFINTHTITEKKFSYLEKLLRESKVLQKRPDDVVRTILAPMLTQTDAFNLIQANTADYVGLVKASSKSTIADFVRQVREHIETTTMSAEFRQFSHDLDAGLYAPVEIIYAEYQSTADDKKFMDVTERMKVFVQEQKQLHQHISNVNMGGDPDSGQLKRLKLVYRYEEQEQSKEWSEGGWWRLP